MKNISFLSETFSAFLEVKVSIYLNRRVFVMIVCVCVRACVRTCVRAYSCVNIYRCMCVCACEIECVFSYVCVFNNLSNLL